jgi:hypothetical protein
MREDDFYLPKNQRDDLTELLTKRIPHVIGHLAITTSRRDRISRPELSQTRKPKRPESRPPLNFESSDAGQELHNALTSAIRFTCEPRGITYDGNPTALGMCGWLARNVTAIALTEGAEDVYHDIDRTTAAAYRAVDHRPILEHYVGTCVACDGDLYARRSDTLYACRCGTTVTKLAQDERILTELEQRNYTVNELVDLVRDRMGMSIKPKTIYDLEYRKVNPVPARGYRVTPGNRRVAMYNAGEVFAALRERQRAA